MAQPLIRAFVADAARALELRDPMVEFGAMQVEAHQQGDLRSLFPDRDILGTDMRLGPGVDRVEDLRGLSFSDGEVGTALCVDTLEHCADPPQAGRELARVTSRDGGICIVSSVMLFGIHGYPSDFFRFTPEGMRAVLADFESTWVAGIGHPLLPFHVVGIGAHGRDLDIDLQTFPSLVEAQELYDHQPDAVRLGVLNYSTPEVLRALRDDAPRLIRDRLRVGAITARNRLQARRAR